MVPGSKKRRKKEKRKIKKIKKPLRITLRN
jgi:hypothetical protein